ncbi:DUF262 domain-containing HNH endonuclease family protein [Pseudomonas sp. RTB3]|uniref:DUF262 domain-containing protein n=1 Tax=unclassified Pseudomonas TaxID=196821 RepID=UPI002B225E51|nr:MULTISPECIES: DUF262 domain-containing HNH endonuclease family protein [unclassified Pseudomonas]MEB0007243.1 DUF262 domain-containing HNH endonuclease family protein [Pseudomonas sp. RTB2]MEB0019426.1 DUF262 domain-containing HNH endonuclease family protein [Pseudomonas sp. RTB3]MEB0270417.1 DUF262 domain-containing HNH endonuclease family protein [Pseudomonas sp. 5B4]
MSSEISQLSIKALLSGNVEYIIPMYQRNYAWEEGEITQLIQDVIDYLPKDGDKSRNYYIGTLVVYERPDSKTPAFETIDGQQRLTTLSLLTSYLKNSRLVDLDWYSSLSIHFDSREHSRATFAAIFEGKFNDDPAEVLVEKQINTGILNGYRLIQKVLPQKLKENKVSPQLFANYLFSYVQIMRVKVPADTDLNHYFEIMNNRGEQLEKHEVLKARMMEQLQGCEQSQNCLHAVWEACANMERYVQMGFTPDQRGSLFGEKDWGRFELADFDALRAALHRSQEVAARQDTCLTLDQIIAKAPVVVKQDESSEDAPERFNTVINFPNFLLHVLRVETQADIPLDDKRLLDTFEAHVLKQPDPVAAVKRFTFSLLRCKYLFDQYVIKREFIKGSDGWSLKRFKWNDGGERSRAGRGSYVNTFGEEDGSEGINRRILMLLSAFHVSTPTLVYKHWLNAALHHLFQAEQIEAQAYLQHMESVAKAFVFDRFLAPEAGSEYFAMIYKNRGVCQTRRESIAAETLESRLTFGNIENNLVFNYLDYLLWLEHGATEPVKSYEFTFRSSVEHYYPQHPFALSLQLPPEVLNSFGNLCLISHEKNSRLSNRMPAEKRASYQDSKIIDSVKQYLMMRAEPWDASAIHRHYELMKDVLLKSLASKHETE